MKEQDFFTIRHQQMIAVERGAQVYFRLNSGAIIHIENKGDLLEVNSTREGAVMMSVGVIPSRLEVINFRTTQDIEQWLASGKVGEHRLTDEERQILERELDQRAKEWALIKGEDQDF